MGFRLFKDLRVTEIWSYDAKLAVIIRKLFARKRERNPKVPKKFPVGKLVYKTANHIAVEMMTADVDRIFLRIVVADVDVGLSQSKVQVPSS
jgi:hypothetical protein